MRKSVKKVLSGIMAGMMILTAAPVSALAANYTPGQVIEKADLPAAKSLSPKLDVVWTAYTGKDQAFYKNGDENWITDGATVTDLSKVSVEGQTVGSGDCTLKANSKGEYFVAASFILHDTAGQFGNVQFKYEVNSALTPGVRSNPTTGWSKTAKLLAMADEAMVDANGEAYMTDNASDVNGTEQYICYGTRLVNDEVPDATWQGDTSTLYNSDEDTNVVIDGIYIATVGFKVAAGTKIEDSLLTFNTDPLMTKYSSIAFGNENEIACSYTMTGISEEGDAEVGLFEVPMKASAPETKSYTVKYVTEDGKDLGTETVEEGKSPASVPALPTKDPDAAGHYSYAWDNDPTTATISADTIFTAKLTTTPHNPQTLESNIVDATCDKAGSKTVTTSCSVCGYVISENNVVIPATGHAWGEWKHDAATAEADATHTRVCGKDASHTETKACDFTAKVTQEATLDQPEITTYTCKDCGYFYTKETAPALAGVTVTVNAVENGSVTLAGQDVTAGGSKKFAENGTYTLVATPNADCTFVGWQTGNKIVSTDATYTTVAIADITYTPVFAESAKPVQFTFVDMFNNVISSQPVASGADVKIPQAPTYTGYTFTGWSVDEAAIKAATSSMTVYAQYEKDAAATYTVTTDADATVAYGSNSAQGTLADIPYGTQVTVSKADATAWAIDGKIVAYGDSYTFYVASDVTVKAASATTQAPVVAAVSANQVAGSYKVEFVATRAMVDGCTYLKSGFVYGKNLTDADLTLANVGKKGSADNSGVVKAAYANSTEGSTQFILSYGISAQTGTASAKAFLTYKDQNGKVQTVYSDVMSHTYA
jgi:uncharacterized repeat protein (TIGR02543 family)